MYEIAIFSMFLNNSRKLEWLMVALNPLSFRKVDDQSER